jgi:hypothetical protein
MKEMMLLLKENKNPTKQTDEEKKKRQKAKEIKWHTNLQALWEKASYESREWMLGTGSKQRITSVKLEVFKEHLKVCGDRSVRDVAAGCDKK